MPEIRCKVIEHEKRCETVLQVSEPVSENASFICKNHPEAVQRRAAGNVTQPRSDVHFQVVQFDPDLRRSRKAQGTSHIARQGSEVNDQPDGLTDPNGLRYLE